MNKIDKNKTAIINGVTGQDGAYLAQLLIEKGYKIIGTTRKKSNDKLERLKSLGLLDSIKIVEMDPESIGEVGLVVENIMPDEIYHLSGQTSVQKSFSEPVQTIQSSVISTLILLETIKKVNKSIKLFHAGSGECFGINSMEPADEACRFEPKSIYGIAKAAAAWQVKIYREKYGLYACTGILFNHESPLRGNDFITRKIVDAARRISNGSDEKLRIGNMNIARDWGWAPEYVDAMWRMLNRDAPEDFVIATGIKQTIENLVSTIFNEYNLDYKKYVVSDVKLFRHSDQAVSIGNPTKAREKLGWESKIKGDEIWKMLVKNIAA